MDELELKGLILWQNKSLSDDNMGQCEPTFKSELWKEKQEFYLYVQHVNQLSGNPNNIYNVPTMVCVLEVQPEELDSGN